MSRELKDLHPYVETLALQLIECCKEQGIKVVVTSTLRTFNEQKELSHTGQSYHQYGLAFDIVCFPDGEGIHIDEPTMYRLVGRIGRNLGLSWGGALKSNPENGHYHWSGGLTLKELMLGDVPNKLGKCSEGGNRFFVIKRTTCDTLIRESPSDLAKAFGRVIVNTPLKIYESECLWSLTEFLGRRAFVCTQNIK